MKFQDQHIKHIIFSKNNYESLENITESVLFYNTINVTLKNKLNTPSTCDIKFSLTNTTEHLTTKNDSNIINIQHSVIISISRISFLFWFSVIYAYLEIDDLSKLQQNFINLWENNVEDIYHNKNKAILLKFLRSFCNLNLTDERLVLCFFSLLLPCENYVCSVLIYKILYFCQATLSLYFELSNRMLTHINKFMLTGDSYLDKTIRETMCFLNDSKVVKEKELDNPFIEMYTSLVVNCSNIKESLDTLQRKSKSYLSDCLSRNITTGESIISNNFKPFRIYVISSCYNMIISICNSISQVIIPTIEEKSLKFESSNKPLPSQEDCENIDWKCNLESLLAPRFCINAKKKITELRSNCNLNLEENIVSGNLIHTLIYFLDVVKFYFSLCYEILTVNRIERYNWALNKIMIKKKTSTVYNCDRQLMKLIHFIESKVESKVLTSTIIIETLDGMMFFYALKNIEIYFISPNNIQRCPKAPKGTLDSHPDRMLILENLSSLVRKFFEAYGAIPIDTPVFELREILTEKYGDNEKLIYNLENQGGEKLSLRYDLTVPFARYMATHGIDRIKRYHIGKVYRRDEPQLNRGRYREFLQCDFDIAGTYDNMIPDIEIISFCVNFFHTIHSVTGKFSIRLNHRELLYFILNYCEVPDDKIRTVTSSIDKLDKVSWEEVNEELCTTKGIDSMVSSRIKSFVEMKGSIPDILLKLESTIGSQHLDTVKKVFSDLNFLNKNLIAMKYNEVVILDLSLARGLDYYTGIIFEVVLDNNPSIGAVAAGGRYDELIQVFSGRKIPSIGLSLGIERLLHLFEAFFNPNATTEKHLIKKDIHHKISSIQSVEVIVCTSAPQLIEYKMQCIQALREEAFKVDYIPNDKMILNKQLQYAVERQIPCFVLINACALKGYEISLKLINDNHSFASNKLEFGDTVYKGSIQDIIVYLKASIDSLKTNKSQIELFFNQLYRFNN